MNNKYYHELVSTLMFFNKNGYSNILVYDNFGNFMGKFPILDQFSINKLIFYQLTRNFFYCYDFLMLPNDDFNNFYKKEIDFFIKNTDDLVLRKNAGYIKKEL